MSCTGRYGCFCCTDPLKKRKAGYITVCEAVDDEKDNEEPTEDETLELGDYTPRFRDDILFQALRRALLGMDLQIIITSSC